MGKLIYWKMQDAASRSYNSFQGLKEYFKQDLSAGFGVSLIALPLCLGIAIASGFPPLAGLITAIVGGVFASRISGNFVTISGPAAGLIVISLAAVESLGYENALGAIFTSGLLIFILGKLKVGKVGDFFPPAAVHGMLAAIGVTIMVKQVYPALGINIPKGTILEVAAILPSQLIESSNEALIIAIGTVLILALHPKIRSKFIQMIPAPIWVLIFAIPAAQFFGTENLSLVEMPKKFFGEGGFALPDFDKIAQGAFWLAVLSFTLVTSIESLLSTKAVDALDPLKRQSNLNQDLISVGLGSSVASSIGGLPMISEIVRSSANVSNGAVTQWSNFFHGTFLLIYLLIGAAAIELIPIPALSAMLVYTGFGLASPKEFKHMFKIGIMELSIFIVTLVAVLASDLIIGIAMGILFKYALMLFKGIALKNLFKCRLEFTVEGERNTLFLKGALIFSNYLDLKKILDTQLEKNAALTLDFSQVRYIDHTTISHLFDLQDVMRRNGKTIDFVGLDKLKSSSFHPLAARSAK